MNHKWKKLNLPPENCREYAAASEKDRREGTAPGADCPQSTYLVACAAKDLQEVQKQLLYEVLGPVFFGQRQADSIQELAELFWQRYGIDVLHDFCEGDEHYEEYLEAQQAIADGMSIYSGAIAFGEDVLAGLAERLWADLEQKDQKSFRRINTMLEE